MKPTNGKASTIFIRDLSKKDNAALKHAREDFKTEFNTVAVMKSLYSYLDQKRTISQQAHQIETLLGKIDELNGSLEQIKESIRSFFAFQDEKDARQEQLTQALATFVQEPKKVSGAKAKRLKGRSGLAALLKG